MRIQNAVAIVTGGASGLGKGTVDELRSGGAMVEVLDLQAADGNVAVVGTVDVTSSEQAGAAIDAVRAHYGRLDIAVQCAGIGYAGRMLPHAAPV